MSFIVLIIVENKMDDVGRRRANVKNEGEVTVRGIRPCLRNLIWRTFGESKHVRRLAGWLATSISLQ